MGFGKIDLTWSVFLLLFFFFVYFWKKEKGRGDKENEKERKTVNGNKTAIKEGVETHGRMKL